MSHIEIDPSWRIPKGPRSEYAFQLGGPVIDAVEQEAWILGVDAKKLIQNFGILGSVMLENTGVKNYVLARPMSSVGEGIHFMEGKFDPKQIAGTESARPLLNQNYSVLILPGDIDFVMEWANKLHIDVETMYYRFMNMGVHILKEGRENNRDLYEQERYKGGAIKIAPYQFNWKK